MTWEEQAAIAIDMYKCPYCKAEPGNRCRSKYGRVLPVANTHGSRQRRAKQSKGEQSNKRRSSLKKKRPRRRPVAYYRAQALEQLVTVVEGWGAEKQIDVQDLIDRMTEADLKPHAHHPGTPKFEESKRRFGV